VVHRAGPDEVAKKYFSASAENRIPVVLVSNLVGTGHILVGGWNVKPLNSM